MTIYFSVPFEDQNAYVRIWRDITSSQFVLMDRAEWRKFWSQMVQLQNIGFDIKFESVSFASDKVVSRGPNSGFNSEPTKQTLLG